MLFVGRPRSSDIALDRVMGVELLRDGVTVQVRGRAEAVTFLVSNPVLWYYLLRTVPSLQMVGEELAPGEQLAPL